jgi:hypothetical protein
MWFASRASHEEFITGLSQLRNDVQFATLNTLVTEYRIKSGRRPTSWYRMQKIILDHYCRTDREVGEQNCNSRSKCT